MNDYYVFQIVCPETVAVIFVGYGRRAAWKNHFSSYRLDNPEFQTNEEFYIHLRNLRDKGTPAFSEKIHENLTRDEAKRLKAERCVKLAQEPKGRHLRNLRPDGKPGQSTREKHRASAASRRHSPETRAKLRDISHARKKSVCEVCGNSYTNQNFPRHNCRKPLN